VRDATKSRQYYSKAFPHGALAAEKFGAVSPLSVRALTACSRLTICF
jgi:hypothetical protein